MSTRPTGKIITRYGREWPLGATELDIELIMFREGYGPEQGGLGKFEHYRRITSALWPWVEQHAWWETFARTACEGHKYITIAGPGSSSKTFSAAQWAVVNWLCSPHNTMVICLSTTVELSRRRIWKDVTKFYRGAVDADGNPIKFPGKLIETPTPIIYLPEDPTAGKTSSISVLPTEKGKEAQTSAKLVGLKNPRVFIICDELNTVGQAVIDAMDNLSKNPMYQFIGLGNPQSHFDSHGLLCEPIQGWDSISVNDTHWKTKRGICIHFDGLSSPSITDNKKYTGIINQEMIDDQIEKDQGNTNTKGYWRMVRGFWPPDGTSDAIYTESFLMKFGALNKPQWLHTNFINLAFLDPAYKSGGDSYCLTFGQIGTLADKDPNTGQHIRALHISEQITLSPPASSSEPENFAIANAVRHACQSRFVTPYFFGLDTTAGGYILADIIEQTWGRGIFRLDFSGNASDKPASITNPSIRAKDKYKYKVTEIWFTAIDFIKASMIRGIPPKCAQQLQSRKFSHLPGGLVQVESKKDMKSRIGHSPDEADSMLGLLQLAIERANFLPSHSIHGFQYTTFNNQSHNDFLSTAQQLDPTAFSDPFEA
jgi:hypothetical protein